MQKLSGLVLDVYDDVDGTILHGLFASPDRLPNFTKEASALTQADRDALPDEAFALILMNGDVELKKFATVDKGNTALSVMYFLKTAHKLPLEAQHVAAENLWAACEQHDLEAPGALQKIALDLRGAEPDVEKQAFGLFGALNTAMQVVPAVSNAKKNLAASRGTQGAVMTTNQMNQRKADMGLV